MCERGRKGTVPVGLALLLVAVLVAPSGAVAAPPAQAPWWEVPPEREVPSPYYDSILYSEIPAKLRELETTSNRVRVEVIGQSAGGRNLFLVTLSAPEAMGRLGQYQAIRQTMLKDPEKAQAMIDQFGDFKVPFFVNASIHGNEYPGVDAALQVIETLAYSDSPQVQEILNNVILLVNVVQNPDGRVLGTRRNANGFDINRDFITQSQPESQATVRVLTEWNPMVLLDLHGFINPMTIDPCTPPHNPNYEYDLYVHWALQQAEAMEAEVIAQTGFRVQIPFRDGYFGKPEGWDDWPPIFAPQYAMYHGAYGHTLETPFRDERGVAAQVAAVWGALKFVAQNRQAMVHDQIEIFRRGFLALPQGLIPPEIQNYDHYADMAVIDFPAAYVIPAGAPLQQNPHEAVRLVDFLLYNDVQVEQASRAFSLDGVEYPSGTYLVWMNQPKRGLANTLLWAGWDISYEPGLTMYDISGWSLPLLWGVSRAIMEEPVAVPTHVVNQADTVFGSVEAGARLAYVYLPASNAAIRATNDLLGRGAVLYRSEEPFTDSGREFGAGTFLLPVDQPGGESLANELANQYGLDLLAVQGLPAGAALLHLPRLAVSGDEGLRFVLREYGFPYVVVSAQDLNRGASLAGYDAIVVQGDGSLWQQLNPTAKRTLRDFFALGGDYLGVGIAGAEIAVKADLLAVRYESGSWVDNGILDIDYQLNDPVAAYYPPDGHGFVYSPVWFKALGEGVRVSATIEEGAFFVSGYWPGWDKPGIAGSPIVVHGAHGPAEVTLMGINPTFRAHPAHTFRLVANAIYDGLD